MTAIEGLTHIGTIEDVQSMLRHKIENLSEEEKWVIFGVCVGIFEVILILLFARLCLGSDKPDPNAAASKSAARKQERTEEKPGILHPPSSLRCL
jgi:hypothetical protein